jgi:hypothetical protein
LAFKPSRAVRSTIFTFVGSAMITPPCRINYKRNVSLRLS